MKKILLYSSLIFTLLASSCSKNEPIVEKPYNKGINITPTPLELTQQEGKFTLSKNTAFVSPNKDVDKIAVYFISKIKSATGLETSILTSKPSSNFINLTLLDTLPLNDEGYLLDVTADGIEIQAKTNKGLFYGMQTLMQLLPAEIESSKRIYNTAWDIPFVSIKDEPRFQYRGMHLDVCRHFADIDFIKKQIDVLALFKINKLHWHLTDDQGWRIEIKQYPELTTKGAARTEGEGNAYGPYFYTQNEVKEIVAYAKDRFIEVIPEIELPGHGVAAISTYPYLSCTGEQIPVRNIWGVATDVYCAGNDSVFQFLENVLTEVIPLFESNYIHIGGDECPKLRWKACPKCQARIKELGLKTDKNHTAEERLQSYFVQRIEKFLATKDKKIIGWDEILEGGLAPSATVMSWQGEEGGIAAGNMGHDVIMTPGKWMYLDKYQGDSKLLPVTIGGFLPLSQVYEYDPMPAQLNEDKQHHILGAQSNVWAEYKYTPKDMEHDIYPRIIALAELTWSAKDRKDYKDFERRIDNQRVRLDMHDINYYIPMPQQKGAPSCSFVAFTDSVTLEFETTEPVKIVYTIDGTDPDLTSTEYKEALTFNENTTLKLRSILLSEKMSNVRTINIEKQNYAPATEQPSDYKGGLKAEYYKGLARKVSDLEGKTPTDTEHVTSPQASKHRVNGYMEVYEDDLWSTILTGYINIPENGVYYFNTDGEMWLDGKIFISNEADNEGTARRFSRSDKSVALAKGLHSIKIIRLGSIFGGWPTQWDDVTIAIRKANEPEFKIMDSSYFE